MANWLEETRERMKKSLEVTREKLAKMRTGRANPAILSDIRVEAYETMLPIYQVASIQVPDPRVIYIKPFDSSLVSAVEKAILKANIGLNPQKEGGGIRLYIPPLNEEMRRNLLKLAKREVEDGKMAVRNIRRIILEQVATAEKNKEISEDEMYSLREKIQKITDEYVEEMERLFQHKEKEILES